MGKYGTNLTGIGAYEGGVNNDKGSPLVANNTDGETSLLFGPAALREVQAGVANGDFAIPPDQASDTITEENPLPYWTFTDVNSAGAITCAVVADATAGSTNVLRFTVNSGTLTGKSVTLTRYVPVPSSASRSFSFYAEASFDNATNSNQATAQLTCQFYRADQTTTTGTAFSSSNTFFSSLTTSTGLTAPDVFALLPSASTTAPADAAFLKLTITIATVATQSASRSVDLTEVRIANGSPAMILTDKSTPTNSPAFIINDAGTLSMGDGGGLGALDVGNNSLLNGTDSVSLQADSVEALGDFRVTGYSNLEGSTLSRYDKAGAADTTTITTALTQQALTNAEVSFTPQFVGQRWLFTFTGYASLNTTTIQYAFIRCSITDSSNNIITSPTDYTNFAFTRSDNFGTSGRGSAVAISKVFVADTTSARKFKLYGTTQTTSGLVLSLAYSQLTAYPIG